MQAALVAAAAVLGAVLGPGLARASVRLAAGDGDGRPTPLRTALTALLTAALLAAAAALTGPRPALVAFCWLGAAGVVLGAVDLAAHRLPDRVTYPALLGCATALLADAALGGSWTALLRALAAAVAAGVVGVLGWAVAGGPGLGDAKLLALLGLVLGWVGWGVLLAAVLLGLLAGSVVAVGLVLTRRAGWRSPLPLGPPLLLGAVLALAVTGAPLPG